MDIGGVDPAGTGGEAGVWADVVGVYGTRAGFGSDGAFNAANLDRP